MIEKAALAAFFVPEMVASAYYSRFVTVLRFCGAFEAVRKEE